MQKNHKHLKLKIMEFTLLKIHYIGKFLKL